MSERRKSKGKSKSKSTEIKVTTKEEYVDMHSEVIELSSGSVFRVRAMNSKSTVLLLSMLPEGQQQPRTDETGRLVMNFVSANLDKLLTSIVIPHIVEPKGVGADLLLYNDVLEILAHIMRLSGLGDVEEADREEFREDDSSTDA
jgi:hypothetical protein